MLLQSLSVFESWYSHEHWGYVGLGDTRESKWTFEGYKTPCSSAHEGIQFGSSCLCGTFPEGSGPPSIILSVSLSIKKYEFKNSLATELKEDIS